MTLPANPAAQAATVIDSGELLRMSKEVSRVLRHRPDSAGVVLDRQGWVPIEALLAGLAARGIHMSRAQLDGIVSTSDKQRFAVSDDGQSIRANQGHSVGGIKPAASSEDPAVSPVPWHHRFKRRVHRALWAPADDAQSRSPVVRSGDRNRRRWPSGRGRSLRD